MKKNILLVSLLATATFAAEAATDSPVMKLATSHSSMEVSLWGARILSLKIRGDEVLWRPREWRLEGEDWAHGGIPLCWPWFGRSGADTNVIHGFARTQKFTLRRKAESANRCELVLGLSSDAGTRNRWPHDFDLEYRIVLTDRLRLELKTVNTGKETFRFTTGFHPYFAIGDRDQTLVTGTDGMRFCDSRKTRALDSVWKGDMLLLSSFDHVFVEKGPTAFHAIEDASRGRRIELSSVGAARLVVWNPGSEEPAEENPAPGRLAAGDWRRLICVEPAILWKEAAVTVGPQAHHTLSAEIALSSPDDFVKLPGEDGMKPAISPAPFPDVLSAYVWRNWFLVPKDRLASVVSASPEELTALAEEMGLPPNPAVLAEWRRKGYITVLRRNWHLLPYGQILSLLDMSRKELAFSLMEDDFLWIKLGSVKPRCAPIVYSAALADSGRAGRRRIARILQEEGIDAAAPEEPRFAFVKRLSVADQEWRPAAAQKDPAFDFRLISSYFADYGDPLGDSEVGSFPEGLLQRLAEQGVNAVWMHTVLRTLAKDPKYPEFGDGCERRMDNLRKLVARAAKYGIKVYLYMNEPRALDPSFFGKPGREEIAGATQNGLQTMCSSSSETIRWLEDSLEKVFVEAKGLGGIFTISASENLSNCATRPGTKATCPRCKTKSRAEIIAAVNSAMVRGMLRGNPSAEALVWNWAWPIDEQTNIIARLPKRGVRLMAVSENGVEYERGGVKGRVNDYSISVVGPGDNARRLWGLAKDAGVGAVAKVQANNTWELSPFPYIPVMDLVAEHACGIVKEGVSGVMLSWSLGSCPAPNLRIYRNIRRGETNPEVLLDRIAAELYGDRAQQARKAWKAFSDGFRSYPFHIGCAYNGPQQWGPANPLYRQPTGYKATMVGIPYDDLDRWRSIYPAKTYAELMDKVAHGFAEGCRLMEGVVDGKELDMYRAEQMHFASCADQVLFVLARNRGDKAAMREVAGRELARAKVLLPIVRGDSRIGYESSNHYFYTPADIIEKVLSCRAVLDRE